MAPSAVLNEKKTDLPAAEPVITSTNERSSDSESETTEDTDEETRNVLLAAGVGDWEDDPNLPCLTIRMWCIGIGFCLLGSAVNTLYTFRVPSLSISQSAIQFLAFPIGRLWQYTVPDWGVTIFGSRVSLNPGPFNHKENILIYILANLSYMTRLSADVLTEQRVFYGLHAGWGFELAITLATTIFGFALAGLFRTLVIEPDNFVWPGVLGNTALNHALHARPKIQSTSSSNKWTMSRYSFFMIVFAASFTWYWFPDFIMPALGWFTFICWAAPKNPVVNQLFGMKSGMSLLPLTFDWNQIAYIGSPLVVPTWAILNLLGSLVFWIWIVSPILYYTNTWSSAYLPFQSNNIYDNAGKVFNVTKVIDVRNDYAFNEKKYEDYSQIYMPIVYGLNKYGLCFATMASLFIWLFLEKHHEIAAAARSSWRSTFSKQASSHQGHYKNTPTWWYAVAVLIAAALAIFACEYYPVQLRWYGAIFALTVSFVFFVPLAWIFATANVKVQIEILCRIIAGYLWEGKVLANIWFFDLGYISGIKGLAFAQDLKFGIYCNIPPRKLMLVQSVGILIGTLGQVAVLNWALNHIPDICTKKAPNGFTCAFSQTHFNTSLIWGAVGPRRFFASDALYRPLLWFFLVGAGLPITSRLLHKRIFPRNKYLKKFHVPIFLGGLNYIPPGSGVNYGSWAIVGLFFGLFIKKTYRRWWTKYNFVLSAALDCSVAIAGVLIFFALFYTGASKNFKWWGTDVHQNTCDWKGCPYKVLGKGEKIPTF